MVGNYSGIIRYVKYKIFLDSNQLYNDYPLEEPFNNNVAELRKFLDFHELDNIEICFPEIVIKERIQHKLTKIVEEIETINKVAGLLRGLGHKIKKISPRKNYKQILENKVRLYLKDNKILRVPIPKIENDILIERAITKMKPFNDNTAGFKDTLIFLSMVESALSQNAADSYIFCSNDYKGFDDEVVKEFNLVTGKDLFILPHITKVKEKLDEIIPLNLHLERRNDQIRNAIMNRTGEIVSAINKNYPRKNQQNSFGTKWTDEFVYQNLITYNRYMSLEVNDENMLGYSYNDIKFLDFNELQDGGFSVLLRLDTYVSYRNTINNNDNFINTFSAYATLNNSDLSRQYRSFSVKVRCNLTNNDFFIDSIN